MTPQQTIDGDRLAQGRDWPAGYGLRQRLWEAWAVLTGRRSLHRAWQNGVTYGSRNEYARIVTQGGDNDYIAMRYLDRWADLGAPEAYRQAADHIASKQAWLERVRRLADAA